MRNSSRGANFTLSVCLLLLAACPGEDSDEQISTTGTTSSADAGSASTSTSDSATTGDTHGDHTSDHTSSGHETSDDGHSDASSSETSSSGGGSDGSSDETTGGNLNCGWGPTMFGDAYTCGGAGEDPSGRHPIECPDELGEQGGPCGDVTPWGCCQDNVAYNCGGGTLFVSDCS